MAGSPEVVIVETGPRDGLQNEAATVPTAVKIEMVERAVAAGVRRVEVTSFVSPRAVPMLADADQVVAGLPVGGAGRWSALVANLRGVERSLAAGVRDLDYVVLASETFSMRNQRASVAQALAVVPEVVASARAAGATVTVTIGAAFGCPFEGEVPLHAVLAVAARVLEAGVDELSFADTVGVGTPDRVRALVAAHPGVEDRLRFHFHNTRNTGYVNSLAAIEAGVATLDATTGGIGGCPFAPKATGNIATEDLFYLADRLGLRTGLDGDRLLDNAVWTGSMLGTTVPGQLSRAGMFPGALVAP